MPRVTQLPTSSQPNGTLDGDELFPLVQDGQTVQGKIYNVRYGLLGQGNSGIYDFELLSYEVNGFVSIASLRFFQAGVEIPSSNVVSIEFTGTAPLQITNGTLNDILDGSTSTYLRFQYDVNTFDTRIRVTFNSGNYRIDEIRVAAPTAASAIDLTELPAYAVVLASGSGSNPQYTFSTYANPANEWEDPWTYELERTAISPVLLSDIHVPQLQLYAVNTVPADELYENVTNLTNVIFRFPNIDVSAQNLTSQVLPVGDNGLPVQKGASQVDVEVMSHRSNTTTIFTNLVTQLDQTFYFFDNKYSANTLIVKNNTGADHTINVIPSSAFSNAKLAPLRATKTLINTSSTYNVTLDVTQFTTVIGSSNLIVAPLSVVHFVEYEAGAIAIWQ